MRLHLYYNAQLKLWFLGLYNASYWRKEEFKQLANRLYLQWHDDNGHMILHIPKKSDPISISEVFAFQFKLPIEI